MVNLVDVCALGLVANTPAMRVQCIVRIVHIRHGIGTGRRGVPYFPHQTRFLLERQKPESDNKTTTPLQMILHRALVLVGICFAVLTDHGLVDSFSSAFTKGKHLYLHDQRQQITQCDALPPKAAQVLAGAGIFCALSCVKLVKQGSVQVVERLGRYHKCLQPGLHLLVPIVDGVRRGFSLREQVFDIPPQKCITLDNAPLEADAVVYWRIVDPKKALYEVENLELAIQNLVLTQLRSEIGKLTLDTTFSARDQINAVLLKDLDVSTEPWGVKISRVEVRDIIPNPDILQAIEMQIAAERKKRAVVIKSEGDKAKAVNDAEGIAEARIIDAKAEAEAAKLEAAAEAAKLELEAKGAAESVAAIASVLGNKSEAARFQLAREYIDAQLVLAQSKNTKILLSSDATSDVLAKALSVYEAVSKD